MRDAGKGAGLTIDEQIRWEQFYRKSFELRRADKILR